MSGIAHARGIIRCTIWIVALPWLIACTVGPDYHSPTVVAPQVWRAEPSNVASRTTPTPIDISWWRSFDDPELTSLVLRLTNQNLDLKVAAEHIRQAQEQRQVVASQGLPGLSASALGSHNRLSEAGILGLLQPAPGASPTFDIFQGGLSASWELDLFGRVRRAVEAADANTEAAVEARHEVALAGVAELAQDYMKLRNAQVDTLVATDSLATARRNVDLVEARVANGYASALDLSLARAEQSQISEALPKLARQQTALIDAIGLLLAEPPRALEAELGTWRAQPILPPTVPVGLPGTVIRQRPDIREAEAKLHAATARTGVATANFYPDVTLVGSANLQSLEFRDAFNLASRAYDAGPSISVPIFQGGQLRRELNLRRSQQREAAIRFQQAVLQAWTDVDEALAAYAEVQLQRQRAEDVLAQNVIALAAARVRYVQGYVDFLNVDTAQQRLLQSRMDVDNLTAAADVALVSLYRAIGGGWQASDVPVPQQTS